MCIGAYLPRERRSPAARVWRDGGERSVDCRARRSAACHCGTLKLHLRPEETRRPTGISFGKFHIGNGPCELPQAGSLQLSTRWLEDSRPIRSQKQLRYHSEFLHQSICSESQINIQQVKQIMALVYGACVALFWYRGRVETEASGWLCTLFCPWHKDSSSCNAAFGNGCSVGAVGWRCTVGWPWQSHSPCGTELNNGCSGGLRLKRSKVGAVSWSDNEFCLGWVIEEVKLGRLWGVFLSFFSWCRDREGWTWECRVFRFVYSSQQLCNTRNYIGGVKLTAYLALDIKWLSLNPLLPFELGVPTVVSPVEETSSWLIVIISS